MTNSSHLGTKIDQPDAENIEMKTQELTSYLKTKHNITIGERAIDDLKAHISKLAKTKVKVSGRSYKTGRRKTIYIKLSELALATDA